MSTELESFIRIHNKSTDLKKLLHYKILPNKAYSPIYYDIGDNILPEEDIYLGYNTETDRIYSINFKKLFSRSMGLIGASRSGKTTFAVRLLYELLDKKENLTIKILDPEVDVFNAFEEDDRIVYHDMSFMDDYDRWHLARNIFTESLKRPLAKECTDFEIILIEEASEIAPERGEATYDLDEYELRELNSCIKAYRKHARRGMKLNSISLNIFQNPFEFRKSILRQLKTLFVFQLEDTKQVTNSLRRPTLSLYADDIVDAQPGICHAYGAGIPNKFSIFEVAEVEELKTSDVSL